MLWLVCWFALGYSQIVLNAHFHFTIIFMNRQFFWPVVLAPSGLPNHFGLIYIRSVERFFSPITNADCVLCSARVMVR